MTLAAPREDMIQKAADWLARQDVSPSPIIPALRDQFGLSSKEACDAIRLRHGEEKRP